MMWKLTNATYQDFPPYKVLTVTHLPELISQYYYTMLLRGCWSNRDMKIPSKTVFEELS